MRGASDDLIPSQQARRDLSDLRLGGRRGGRDEQGCRANEGDEQKQQAGAAVACDGDTPWERRAQVPVDRRSSTSQTFYYTERPIRQ
jgi:hypothetical protein